MVFFNLSEKGGYQIAKSSDSVFSASAIHNVTEFVKLK